MDVFDFREQLVSEYESFTRSFTRSRSAGYVARVAGNAYVLDATDAETLALLRQLAASGFLSAEWALILENFGVFSPSGERLRYAQLSLLSDEYDKSVLVGPLLEKPAGALPEQLRQVGDEYQPFVMWMGGSGKKVSMTSLEPLRIESAVSDSGFEMTPEVVGAALRLRSARFPQWVDVEPLAGSMFKVDALADQYVRNHAARRHQAGASSSH